MIRRGANLKRSSLGGIGNWLGWITNNRYTQGHPQVPRVRNRRHNDSRSSARHSAFILFRKTHKTTSLLVRIWYQSKLLACIEALTEVAIPGGEFVDDQIF